MYIKRNWGIVRHGVAALTFTLALAGTSVAGAATASSLADDTPMPTHGQTVNTAHTGGTLDTSVMSALATSMKWRSNSFSIAGSRAWSKLIVLTSTSINVRLPIN
jgi:hypothetical protein